MEPTARPLAVGLVAVALFAFAGREARAAPKSAQVVPASAQPNQPKQFRARTAAELLAKKRLVARASVIINMDDKTCGGSVVGSPSQVLTAAHCVPDETATLEVIAGRRRIAAVVALIDRTRDTALLALEEAVDVVPLELDPELPAAGDRILFVGRPDSLGKAQLARVVRLGSCPSLPGVSDALFTSIHARPGDSGAPLVNDTLRVVGVIHGGAACHIAAPTSALAKQLAAQDDGSQPRGDDAAPSGDTEHPGATGRLGGTDHPAGNHEGGTSSPTRPSAIARYQLGPFTFEKLGSSNGFRFRFQFRLGTKE